jgi:hypothetical protein
VQERGSELGYLNELVRRRTVHAMWHRTLTPKAIV